ncbi:threonine/serine exporter family protein [Ammoniphilus sp. YIM 78166]|uniref:threonine/serine exporter family protein n=1 Tax=Ammoniphilus sp. YIM 78166 TaxID=1644106 RepID=UPI00106F70D4|nr:threonine/serine exporter family protein [Ammoniphilus sp. YIM 78166]
MTIQRNSTSEIIEACLLAGKIMLENGAETMRVEDTMMRMAASFGIPQSHSFVTPTAIIFSLEGADPTRLIRISERSTDLQKVAKVNSISRRASDGELTLQETVKRLKQIEAAKGTYPLFIQILAAAATSGCFLIMFQGQWQDFIPALVSGGMGYLCAVLFQRLVQVKFFAEFLAAFVIGLLSVAFVVIGLGLDLDKIIIGSVMPLVPGVLITNAVRDLIAGHLVSGVTKGAEALLTAFAIGSGIAVVISLY